MSNEPKDQVASADSAECSSGEDAAGPMQAPNSGDGELGEEELDAVSGGTGAMGTTQKQIGNVKYNDFEVTTKTTKSTTTTSK